MSKKYILLLDQGTSSSRSFLYDLGVRVDDFEQKAHVDILYLKDK